MLYEVGDSGNLTVQLPTAVLYGTTLPVDGVKITPLENDSHTGLAGDPIQAHGNGSFWQPWDDPYKLAGMGELQSLDNDTFPYENVTPPLADVSATVQHQLKQEIHMIVIYSLAYSIVFLLGIIGNSLVVFVVFKNKRMHNVTNYFIVNLAIADILVCLFCLPITLLSNLYRGWLFGAVMCKVTPFLQGVAVSASVNTLAAIAFDRYLAICHTLKFRLTFRIACCIIIFIWVASAGIMTPWAVFYQEKKYISTNYSMYFCIQDWPHKHQEKAYFLGAIFLTCYTLPLIMISVFYILIGCKVWNRNAPGIANTNQVINRSRIKVLKMLLVVVIMFGFSWLPLYAVHMRLYFGRTPPSQHEFNLLGNIVLPICQWLGSFNSCVNPIIYCFFSKRWRRNFTEIVHCCKRSSSTVYFNRNNSARYHSVSSGHSMYESSFRNSKKSMTTATDV